MGFDQSDVDQCWESWRDLFYNAVESFIPKIKLKDAKSWIDGKIIKQSKKKKRLLKQAKQSNSAVHWDNYRLICKQIKTATKRKYSEFPKDLQSDLKDNPKKFWNFYRSKTKSARIPKVVHLGSVKASTSAAKANLLNHFFASVFLKADLHTVETTTTFTAQDDELHSIQATDEEVLKALEIIDPSKACVPDQIPGRVLRECSSEIAPSLTRLINFSLSVGCVPQDWKRTNIVPVFKKGDNEDVCNYRAISLLSLISKIAERVVFDRFSNFIAIPCSMVLSKDSLLSLSSWIRYIR